MSQAPHHDDPFRLLRDLKGLVALHQRFGIDSYPKTPELLRFVDAPAAPRPVPGRPSSPPVSRQAANPPPQAANPPPQAAEPTAMPPRAAHNLDELRETLAQGCTCPAGAGRGRAILGQGNPKAALFIVGDQPTPGQGQDPSPFAGEEGVLLARMLKAIGLEMSAVYLTTLIKCHPRQHTPDSGPTAEMVKACLPLLIAQIEAVAPTVICAMGAMAAQALLHTKTPLVRLRGRLHPWQRFALMPTFAPGFLLKNPEMKPAAWIDLQLIQGKLADPLAP